MKDLSELRFKESDRLTSIHQNLLSSGIDSTIVKDDLIIKGSRKKFLEVIK